MVTITLINKHNTFISHKKINAQAYKTCENIIQTFLHVKTTQVQKNKNSKHQHIIYLKLIQLKYQYMQQNQQSRCSSQNQSPENPEQLFVKHMLMYLTFSN